MFGRATITLGIGPTFLVVLTDARSDGRATLLVSSRAAVTREAGDSVLARALSARLIARLIQCAHRVTVARCHNTHTQATSQRN